LHSSKYTGELGEKMPSVLLSGIETVITPASPVYAMAPEVANWADVWTVAGVTVMSLVV
jgi:hypothetical protein